MTNVVEADVEQLEVRMTNKRQKNISNNSSNENTHEMFKKDVNEFKWITLIGSSFEIASICSRNSHPISVLFAWHISYSLESRFQQT